MKQIIFVALVLAFTGCASQEVAERAPLVDELAPQLEVVDGTFADVVPEAWQTRIVRHEADGDPSTPDAEIDARGERVFFPMPRDRRAFDSWSRVTQEITDNFGATEHLAGEDGADAARGSYVQYGTSYFEDRTTQVRYRITEPVLAWLGGTDGWVDIGGKTHCVDPDGECGETHASYLEPDAFTTAPTHDPECGSNGVCVEFHSFYNRTWFPAPWARHGTNIRFTTYSALPSTRMRVSGAIHVPSSGAGSITSFPLPNQSNEGQDSIESAVWCFGTTACVEYRADAVCGSGTITDPDINRYGVRTGNGPANGSVCPG